MAIILRDIHSLKRGTSHVEGSFAVDSSGDPTTVKGVGFSVAHTSTGLYTVTFSDKYQALISAVVTLMSNAADDKFCQLGAWSTANSTLALRVWDVSGAALTDIAEHANTRIQFDVVLQYSKY